MPRRALHFAPETADGFRSVRVAVVFRRHVHRLMLRPARPVRPMNPPHDAQVWVVLALSTSA